MSNDHSVGAGGLQIHLVCDRCGKPEDPPTASYAFRCGWCQDGTWDEIKRVLVTVYDGAEQGAGDQNEWPKSGSSSTQPYLIIPRCTASPQSSELIPILHGQSSPECGSKP